MSAVERIYPSWEEIENFHDPLTEGEYTLARFFDDNLREEWEIFVQPYLNGSRPDIVILNPKVGVMIYEVKDWALETYQWKKNKQIAKSEVFKHFKQVDHYRKKIIEQLIPDIGEKIDSNQEAFGIVKTGIYLHKIKGTDARKLFGTCNHISTCRYMAKIGFDDLEPSNLKKIVPDHDFWSSKYMKEEWAKELEFWLKPPFHSKEQTETIELTKQQKKHAKPNPGHHRLRGAAGSGKTLVIAYRAAKLSSEGYKVLIITFNLTLWHYIRDMIKRTPYGFDWHISFNHFHGFCNDILNELNIPKPQENYFDSIVGTVHRAIENNEIDNFKFDAILIDEAQDYKREWYDLLSSFLTERNEMLLACDEGQNIYGRDLSWMKGRWGELTTVHRLPPTIGDFAKKFSQEFGLKEAIEIEEYVQLTIYEKAPILIWENINIEDWLSALKDAYETIKYQQVNLGEGHASDIVILTPSRKLGMDAVKLFEELNINVNHVFELEEEVKYHRHKKSFWMGDSRLKISTIHSFKGWEALHVILLIPPRWNGDENLDYLIKTAITRTRKNLIILNSNKRYWEFGESYTRNTVDIEKIDSIELEEEKELELWIETLPFPLASILWAGMSSFNYEHKVKYFLRFFESMSQFTFNLLLSILSSDKQFYEMEVEDCIQKQSDFRDDWIEKPSFGIWNNLLYCITSIIRRQMKDKYNHNQSLRGFEKSDSEFLNRLSDVELVMLLKKVSKYRNIWDAHGPLVSEEQYKDRFQILMIHLNELKSIIRDVFEKNMLILPVQGILREGMYYYTVKRYTTTRPPFRPLEIQSEAPMDNSWIYLVNPNEKIHLQLLPLVIDIDDNCYYYNGKDYETGQARYSSYHNNKEPEILMPMEKMNKFIELI